MSDRTSNAQSDNYETKMTLVEEIIEEIEAGKLPLEEIFEKFAIAVEHLRECETFLAQGKQEMKLLIETLGDTRKPDNF